MKHYYNNQTKSFYIDEINAEIPKNSVEITEEQHNELYNAINNGCIIFDNLTFSEPPPSSFHKWNETAKKWVEDVSERNLYICEQNTITKNSLINEASEKIELLQDIIDLDMQESNEDEQLKQWKKYRALLNRIDVNTAPKIDWPEKPE